MTPKHAQLPEQLITIDVYLYFETSNRQFELKLEGAIHGTTVVILLSRVTADMLEVYLLQRCNVVYACAC